MRVLIAGAAGLLGQQLVKEYQKRRARVFAMNKKDLDITSRQAIVRAFKEARPHLLINCAAFTDVDKAEADRETAYAVNGLAPRLLALSCRQYGTVLVHISTDYIFNGSKKVPYLITDQPDPLNVYGASKLAGEQGVRESGCKYYIVRTSWLFGPGGKDFAAAIIKLATENDLLKVVDDRRANPTYVPDLAVAVADLGDTGIYGTYHLTNQGTASKFEFAQKIAGRCRMKTIIEPCPAASYPCPASRPANSALDPFPATRVLGYSLPAWENALDRYLKAVAAAQKPLQDY